MRPEFPIPTYLVHEDKLSLKALLISRNISQKELAARLNVSPATISMVLAGKRISRRLRQAIANELGVTLQDLWPAS